MRLKLNRETAGRCKFDLRGFKTLKAALEIGKRQPDFNLLILVKLATGSQMQIHFERV